MVENVVFSDLWSDENDPECSVLRIFYHSLIQFSDFCSEIVCKLLHFELDNASLAYSNNIS